MDHKVDFNIDISSNRYRYKNGFASVASVEEVVSLTILTASYGNDCRFAVCHFCAFLIFFGFSSSSSENTRSSIFEDFV
jgi:hypothetical protein